MFSNLKEDLKVFYEHHNRSKLAFFYYPMATAIIFFRFSCFCYKYKVLRPISYIIVRLNDLLHGIWIGPKVKAGPGLFLAHSRGLVVNPETIIGSKGTGLRIGDNATVGAGAVVINDVDANSVVVGNPARKLS